MVSVLYGVASNVILFSTSNLKNLQIENKHVDNNHTVHAIVTDYSVNATLTISFIEVVMLR